MVREQEIHIGVSHHLQSNTGTRHLTEHTQRPSMPSVASPGMHQRHGAQAPPRAASRCMCTEELGPNGSSRHTPALWVYSNRPLHCPVCARIESTACNSASGGLPEP